MNIAELSIRRPIFISSIVILMIFTGVVAFLRLGVDLFPPVTFPVVAISTVYAGAGPEEIEDLISKPLEEELSGLAGVKRITSRNQEGLSVVIVEFTLETDVDYAEQQVRARTARVAIQFPDDAQESLVQRFDPDEQPVLRIALQADLPPDLLYDLAKENVKPLLEQASDVGGVKIIGGTRREIQVELDRRKLNSFEVPASRVASQLKIAGLNVPVGSVEQGASLTGYRAMGRFDTIQEVENLVVSFGQDVGSAVQIKDLGRVIDGTSDATAITKLYAPLQTGGVQEKPENFVASLFHKWSGKKSEVKRQMRPALFLDVYKQSGANTIRVVDSVLQRMDRINSDIGEHTGKPKLSVIRDGSNAIRANVDDVGLAIVLGIILAVVVVYLFLGNLRSTIITGLALPNSLLGAFLLMYVMGFTINIMTLLALSLCVGLLVDDAIVVRESIFRKIEEGHSPSEAARIGTSEVALAVIATTATVVAVFLPIGFLTGIVGQFFKEFGLTVVFAMAISLFDALTIAPMLSAYFAGKTDQPPGLIIRGFRRFQDWLDAIYAVALRFTLRHRLTVIAIFLGTFVLSLFSLAFVKKTFLPPNDTGEFQVTMELPPGSSLQASGKLTDEIAAKIAARPEVDRLALISGGNEGDENKALIGVQMVPASQRSISTVQFKDQVREMLKPYGYARARVADYSAVGGGVQYPFNLNIRGDNLEQLDQFSSKLLEEMRKIPDLTDVDSSLRPGKPEFRIIFDRAKMSATGISPVIAGNELRYQIAGSVVGQFHDRGTQYDVLLRLQPDQRDLKSAFKQTEIPNLNQRMIPLAKVSTGQDAYGPALILRQDRSRIVQITANLAGNGALDSATKATEALLKGTLKPPPGISFQFVGQSEDFKELIENVLVAFMIALVFIYLVLASLYESFITPITILSALPPAISGAFFALLITGEMLNIFSMIGIILLMGLVAKNSILLVDHAVQKMQSAGDEAPVSREEAIEEAGAVRLRPILMTSFAMIAGTLPVALGLGEVSKSRTAMGVAIIGGLVLSTLVTLLVVPALFEYVDRIRAWVEGKFSNR